MPVIELTRFRLAGDADEQHALELDERVRTGFLYQQRGLLRATTARGDDGDWLVMLLWDSGDDADAAAAGAGADPSCLAFAAIVDPTTVERARYQTFD